MSEVEELQKKVSLAQQEIIDILSKYGMDGFAGYIGAGGYLVTLWMDAPGNPPNFEGIGKQLETMMPGRGVSGEDGIYKPRK